MDPGLFPFGQPNSERPSRVADDCKAMVIGLHPSAFHVAWTAPKSAPAGRDRTGIVKALAVDVEPTVFWEGNEDGGDDLLKLWLKEVGFVEGDDEGQHGRVDSRLPAANGSNGRKIIQQYLEPLGLKSDEVTFTDVFRHYMVKTGTKAKREMRDAIEIEYNAIADFMGVQKSHLLRKIHERALPGQAQEAFGDKLKQEFTDGKPELVITLGEEAWRTVDMIFGYDAHSSISMFDALYGEAYGRPGTLRSGNHVAKWLPLVHPSLLRNAAPTGPLPAGRRTVAGWNQRHFKWIDKTVAAAQEATA